MEQVNYLIIGAGLAGLTLRHFLRDPDTVLVDPRPGSYKIGESLVPELFYNLEMRSLVPYLRRMKSFSPKRGTFFMNADSAVSFPLPEDLAQLAGHIERAEFERLMAHVWGIAARREKVVEVDPVSGEVATDRGAYRVRKQVIDCSGPSMVLATLLGERQEITPAFAIWTYFDIEETRDDLFAEFVRGTGRRYMRLYVPEGKILPEREDAPWRPSQTTFLTWVGEGAWLWQIPLFGVRMLSVGVVSRTGKIEKEAFLDIVERFHSPNYKLRARTLDGSSPYNTIHRRNHLAKRAKRPSTSKYILTSDAFAFADPVYSVGTGLAVNKCIQVSAQLNAGAWTEETSSAFNEDYERLYDVILEAFNYWYSGEVLSDDDKAVRVQRNMLQGECLRSGLPLHYGRTLRAALGQSGNGGHEDWSDLPS